MNKKKIMSVVASFSMIIAYVTQTLTSNTNHKSITFSPLTAYADDAVTQEEYVVGASLVLDGSLKVNIKFNCDISTNDNWTINGKAFSTTMKEVSYAVPAKDFMNDIIIKHDSKTVHTFSVADMLTQYKSNEKTKKIATKLESYCKAAKDYFEGNVVADYSDSFESIKAEIGSHEVEMGDDYYASSLLLKSSTILRHYYTKPIDGANATSNGYYYIEEAVSAHQYSSFDSYCVNDYIFKALSNPSADTSLKNLCAALYYYGKAAMEYAMKPENIDTDGDGLFDELEIKVNCSPYKIDSDGNGVADGDEDYDCDSIANLDEIQLGICPYAKDSDYDGINDYDELYLYKTDPNNEDTDGDFIIDGDELILNTNPNELITNGIKDNEKIKEYKFSGDCDQIKEFNTAEQPFKFSFNIKAAGVVDKYVKVAETGYSYAIKENPYIIGKSPCISYDDQMKVDNVSVYFAMQDGYNSDISKYTVFYYWEGYNLLIPVETYYDESNKTVYAHNIYAGTYCLVNTDELRDSLGKGTAPKAAPPRLNAPDIAETGDDPEVSVGATTIWKGHEYFLITCDDGMEYPDAVGICARYGGYPATITSSEENDVVDGVSDWNEIWLGAGFAKPSALEYILTWCTGEKAEFESWRNNFFIYSITEEDHVGSFFGLWSIKKKGSKLNAVVCEREMSIYNGLTFKTHGWELDPDPNADSDGDGIPDRQELSPFDEGTFGADGSYTPAQYRRYIEVANDLGIHVNEKIGSCMADIRTPSYSSDPHKKDSDDDEYQDNEDGKPFKQIEDLIEILEWSTDDKNLCKNDAIALRNKYESIGRKCNIRPFSGYDSFISQWNRIGDHDEVVTGKYYYNVTDVILISHGAPKDTGTIKYNAIELGNNQHLVPKVKKENSEVFGIESISNCRRFDKLDMLVCDSDKLDGYFDKTFAETFFSHFPSIKKVYAFDCACGLTAELDWVGTWTYDDPIIYKLSDKPTSYTYYRDLPKVPKGQTCYSRTSDYNDDLYPGLRDMVLFFNFRVYEPIGGRVRIAQDQVSKDFDADYYGFDPVLEG